MATLDKRELIAAQTAHCDPQKPLSLFGLVNLNAFWFSNSFHWEALQALIIPSMVVHFLDPRFKAINLLAVVALGTPAAFLLTPLAGALSDWTRWHLGRRPFLILGTMLNVMVLIAFAFSPTWVPQQNLLLAFAILFLLLQLSNTLAHAPWSATIADQVPSVQRGLASGWRGLLASLGTVIGSVVAGSLLGGNQPLAAYRSAVIEVFLLIAILQTLCVTYTVVIVKETLLPSNKKKTFHFWSFLRGIFFKPSTYPDVSWVLLGHFLVRMGIGSVFYFLVFYFQDVLGGPGAKMIFLHTSFSGEQFNGVLFQPVLLLTSLPTSILGGWASDRWGRKKLVYLSGAMMTVACVIFLLFPSQYFALLSGACFGVAYGAYTSVEWALMADVLPPTDEAGKFLGVWTAIGILPQFVATAISGVLLQLLQPLPHHFNYAALFLMIVLYLLLGTTVISRVKGRR